MNIEGSPVGIGKKATPMRDYTRTDFALFIPRDHFDYMALGMFADGKIVSAGNKTRSSRIGGKRNGIVHFETPNGEHIKSLREQYGISANLFAGLVQISKSTYLNIENGKVKAGRDYMQRIADAHLVPLEEVIR